MSLLSSSTVDGCSLLYVRLAVLILCSSHLLCVEAIYCGKRNCYDVLQVSREDDRTSIRRAYHKLARVHHPDRQKTAKAKAEAEETIRIINAAYEVLSDPEQREEYDYMLDHPDEMYYNYYQYYRRRYAPKVDVRLVILAIVLICSVFQYVGQWTSYNQAISYLVRDPKHRARAKEIANSEGLLAARKREDGRRYTREEMKDKEEELLRSIISRTVELKGDCSKPSLRRVLLIQIFCLPYTLFQLMHWAFGWIWNYYILRREYDEA
ncbi:unnamed protein product [Calicophoron daubneyi]|uniref:J domain-containing protein n=1 Tax=Calicophoron daubneyi TaxID=300641 RepID=A0AAV2T091_CALDB